MTLFFNRHHNASHDEVLTEQKDQECRNAGNHDTGRNDVWRHLALQLKQPHHQRPHLWVGNNHQRHHEFAVSGGERTECQYGQDRLRQTHGNGPELNEFTTTIDLCRFIKFLRQ